MDETSGSTMRDDAGANDGTLRNVTLGRPGVSGSAYGFDGATSVVTVPTSSSLNPGASPFWMSVHVNFTGTPTAAIGGDYDVIRKGLSGTAGGFYKMELVPLNGGVHAHCSMEGSLTSLSITADADLSDGRWHTVECLKDGSSISVVVDGAKKSKPIALGRFSNTAPLAIGAKAEGGDWYDGVLDEASFGTGAPGNDAPPVPIPPSPSPAPAPAPPTAPPTAQAAGPGSGKPSVAPASCVRLRPSAVLRKAKLRGGAKLTLHFDAATGVLRIHAPHHKVRSITVTLDGRRLRRTHGGSLTALLQATSLASGRHVLRVTVHPRRGKALTLTVQLTSTSC
jgi:Concanavalin A-like lectin/glucanases superfamily